MATANATCFGWSLSGVVCYGVFFNHKQTDESFGVDCASNDNFDPDVAGIGVVVSFVVAALITTFASTAAAILDNLADSDKALLPQQWRPGDASQALRQRSLFFRRILNRLILDFADQQLVTGFALLISAWVKLHRNPMVDRLSEYLLGSSDPAESREFSDSYPSRAIPTATFSLIVFLCMASSSSHLASILVLREYMESHRNSARLRIALMVIFSMSLSVTISLALSLTTYFAWLAHSIFGLNEGGWVRSEVPAFVLSIGCPLVVMLAMFWHCTVQLLPRLKKELQNKLRSTILARLRKWLRLSAVWYNGPMRLLPSRWRAPFTEFVKRTFWFIILGNEFFIFSCQVVLAFLSITWIGLQRFARPPELWAASPDFEAKPVPSCSLHNVAEPGNAASFGQLLPLIFLVLPILSAYGSYIEEKDQRDGRGPRYSFIPDQGGSASPSNPSREQRGARNGDRPELSLLSPRQNQRSSGSQTSNQLEAAYFRHDAHGSATGSGQSSPPEVCISQALDVPGSGSLGRPDRCSTGN